MLSFWEMETSCPKTWLKPRMSVWANEALVLHKFLQALPSRHGISKWPQKEAEWGQVRMGWNNLTKNTTEGRKSQRSNTTVVLVFEVQGWWLPWDAEKGGASSQSGWILPVTQPSKEVLHLAFPSPPSAPEMETLWDVMEGGMEKFCLEKELENLGSTPACSQCP